MTYHQLAMHVPAHLVEMARDLTFALGHTADRDATWSIPLGSDDQAITHYGLHALVRDGFAALALGDPAAREAALRSVEWGVDGNPTAEEAIEVLDALVVSVSPAGSPGYASLAAHLAKHSLKKVRSQ